MRVGSVLSWLAIHLLDHRDFLQEFAVHAHLSIAHQATNLELLLKVVVRCGPALRSGLHLPDLEALDGFDFVQLLGLLLLESLVFSLGLRHPLLHVSFVRHVVVLLGLLFGVDLGFQVISYLLVLLASLQLPVKVAKFGSLIQLNALLDILLLLSLL